MKTKFITILILTAAASFANAQPARYENFDSATSLLSSYFDAINRKDYRRAYGYWQTPADSFENFAKAYAETEKVRLIVEPPTRIEGAAGSLYVEIPAVLIAARRNGRQQMFAGCYTLRKSNLRSGDIPKKDVWHIYRADLKPAAADTEIPQMLERACRKSMPDNRQSSRVLGVIGFDGKQLGDSIKAPQTVGAGKDFGITITTSGNGCAGAGLSGQKK